jgi:hypothetical protein
LRRRTTKTAPAPRATAAPAAAANCGRAEEEPVLAREPVAVGVPELTGVLDVPPCGLVFGVRGVVLPGPASPTSPTALPAARRSKAYSVRKLPPQDSSSLK